MAVTLFAAINVGSYDVEMKIFQYVTRKEFREIDHVRYRIELGKDTYTTGKIGVAKIEELCKVLNDFVKIMNGYKVKAYRACATSAVREAENHLLIVEYVEHMTGIHIEILDNSEQRFLDYKSIAFGEKDFYKIIQKGTAIVEVGGGRVQVCLFDNDKLVTTQNIRIGNLRIREKVADFSRETLHTEEMVEELINNDLESFKKMYLKDRNIKYLIITGDYILELLKKNQVTASEFQKMYEGIIYKHPEEIAKEYGIPSESASLILPSVTIYKRIIEELEAEAIYLPGTSLSDGIAYDYAQKMRYIRPEHQFSADIIAAARIIAKRYQGNKGHIRNLENLALPIFDKMRKISGAAQCSYSIIMATEIIGLSAAERRIIANVVRYNTMDFTLEDVLEQQLRQEDYLIIVKLVAILRVANALDRSHKQKFEQVRLTLKDAQLEIVVDTSEDITLEKGLFPPKADYFEEVFHVRPLIRKKRNL